MLYKELEYIESTGTQYIDTGVTSQSGTLLVKALAKYKNTGTRQLCGYSSASTYYIDCTDTGLLGLGGGTNLSSTISAWNWNLIEYTNLRFPTVNSNLTATLQADDSSIIDKKGGSFSTSSQIQLNGFTMFAIVDSTNYTNLKCSMQMKYCQIYDNYILVRYFIPCKNSSNVIGMYDIVNDVFYTNSGEGEFVAGPEI